MRKFSEILSAALVLGFLNYLLNPNRPLLVETLKFHDCGESGGWIFVAASNDIERQKFQNIIFLDDLSFESEISKLLEIWAPGKNVGILQSPKSQEIAKKLKNEYGIDRVYILEDWR